MIHDLKYAMFRMECALSPNRIPAPDPVTQHFTFKNEPYWRSGYVTSIISGQHCLDEATKSVRTLANIPDSLKRIVWC